VLVILGLLVVFGATAFGYYEAGGAFGVLFQPAELIIIGGAAIGSLVCSTPGAVLKNTAAQLKGVMGSGTSAADYKDLLAMLYQLFKQVQQQGVMSLEAHFDDPKQSAILSKYPKFMARHDALDFLADSVKVVMVGGIAPHDLESMMEEDLRVHHDDALKPAAALNRIGDALPGLGIVAAVLGVVITMGHIDGPPAEIGERVGAALVGTFLGILLSYGMAQPVAGALESRVNDDMYYCLCIKAGLLAVYKGNPPAIAVEFARRVLPHNVRPSFNDTEKLCKAATLPSASQQARAA
jgi:chemotaxis protein MotA